MSTSTLASPSTTAVVPTTVPSPKVNVAAMAAAEYFVYGWDGIRSDSGSLIWQPESMVWPYIARDGLGGFVFIDEVGLWWAQSGADAPVFVTDPGLTTGWLREVIATEDGPVARFQEPVDPVAGGELVDVLIDLATGQVVATTLDGRIRDIDDREWWVVGDLAVSVTHPEIEWLEEGGVDEVIEPAHLIVSRAPGGNPSTPVFDIVIGADDEAFAEIHDFDGRRVVVSTRPYEPAAPQETFYVIDLACADCLITFRSPVTRVALNGPDVTPPGEIQVPVTGPDSTGR